LLFDATLRHDLLRAPVIRTLSESRRHAIVDRLAPPAVALVRGRYRSPPATAEAFQRRRDVNVERLSRADRVVAMSTRVAEIHELLGVAPERLRSLQFTLSHIEHLRPRLRQPHAPVTFATLGGSESPAKGSQVLLDAARALSGTTGFRLLVFGHPEPAFVAAAGDIAGLELRGPYGPGDLDRLLDEVDVGIVPSMWEEAYGYAGVEFLAKAIPVIGNAIGGIVDYVRDGETGWLNRSCTASELAQIIRGAIAEPQLVDRLNATLRERRDEVVMPFSRHADAIEDIYREELARRA
jgi:glycosyltransferase involved in cell wall biosynthesis